CNMTVGRVQRGAAPDTPYRSSSSPTVPESDQPQVEGGGNRPPCPPPTRLPTTVNLDPRERAGGDAVVGVLEINRTQEALALRHVAAGVVRGLDRHRTAVLGRQLGRHFAGLRFLEQVHLAFPGLLGETLHADGDRQLGIVSELLLQ